jgi:hypothetical protein
MASEFDYEAAVIAMLTLRINTPVGEWLSDKDLEVFGAYQQEAVDTDGEDWGTEYLLLAMMNTAWLAIQHLALLTEESTGTWLQRIAVDIRSSGTN